MSAADEARQRIDKLAEMVRGFAASVPHNRALGLEILSIEAARVRMRLPYSAELVGNPETGCSMEGAITALLDACAGAAVFMALDKPMPIATLDLRIDYLKPALAELGVIADLECYKTTSAVAFVRGFAYHHDRDDPIAAAAGAFMLATRRRRSEDG